MSRAGRRARRLAAAAAVLALAACSRGTDHERLGDRRYAEGAWLDALAEYRLASRQRSPSWELRAKLAHAAMHAGDLPEAVRAWRELARTDPASRAEAVEGLVRTARAAVEARDPAGLRAAAAAMRELAPERLGPALGEGLRDLLTLGARPEDPDLLLAAAARASRVEADSLVALWADAAAVAGRCDWAARAFESLLRRRPSDATQRLARGGLGACELDAGRTALAAGELDEAIVRFRAAIAWGIRDSTVRLAWALLGDASWADGDSAAAADAYARAIAGGGDDNPVVQRAREQLRKLTGQEPAVP